MVGSTFPMSPSKQLTSKAVTYGVMGVIGTALFGEKMLPAIGLPYPAWLSENKGGVCIGAWFVGNIVGQNLMSSGAFEIYYDGQLLHSKLSSGKLPSVPRLIADLETAMKERTRRISDESNILPR